MESTRDCVRLVLPYRPPIAWEALLAFLGARAAPATECIQGGVYSRTIRIGDCAGVVRVTRPESAPSGDDAVLHVEVDASLAPQLDAVSARMRLLFDLDADPEAVTAHLTHPVRIQGETVLAPGSRVTGVVTDATRSAKVKGRAHLALRFDSLTPHGMNISGFCIRRPAALER